MKVALVQMSVKTFPRSPRGHGLASLNKDTVPSLLPRFPTDPFPLAAIHIPLATSAPQLRMIPRFAHLLSLPLKCEKARTATILHTLDLVAGRLGPLRSRT
jgi:hypothetical protein